MIRLRSILYGLVLLASQTTNIFASLQQSTLSQDHDFHLGVTLDAGRHFFPVAWIHSFLHDLHKLGFTLLHFRLTDDEAYALPSPSPSSSQSNRSSSAYTTEDLKSVVSLAKRLNITIVPEINVPGSAASWPLDLIIPCPEYMCKSGRGIGLNISNARVYGEVRRVIQQTIDIFDNPPFLHLGGYDGASDTSCLREADPQNRPNYTDFEVGLQRILSEVRYPLEQTVRSKPTYNAPLNQIGNILHLRGGANTAAAPENQPFFETRNLDSLRNDAIDGWEIYGVARQWLQLYRNNTNFRGILVKTEALSSEGFVQMNVIGRLLGVAMSAAPSTRNITTQPQFVTAYQELCPNIITNSSVCKLSGGPSMSMADYKVIHQKMKAEFSDRICQRATKPVTKRQLKANTATSIVQTTAYRKFWDDLGNELSPPRNRTMTSQANRSLLVDPRLFTSPMMYRGVILDLVDDLEPLYQLQKVIHKYMAPLGLNTLQLTMVSNRGFVLETDDNPRLFGVPNIATQPLKEDDWRDLVRNATSLGIQVIPEISIATNAGGWFGTGLLVPCTNVLCENNGSMATNITNGAFLPIVLTIIQDLYKIFKLGSDFIHLGSDERLETLKCWKESGVENISFDQFERTIARSLKILDLYDDDHILRWENSEQVHYPSRAGSITHYQRSIPPKQDLNETATFGTVIITEDKDPWDIYLETRKWADVKPLGLLAKIVGMKTAEYSVEVAHGLLAFSMASSSDFPLLEKEELEETIESLCQGWCNADALHFQPPKPNHKTLCDTLTDEKTFHVMRKNPFA